MRSTIKNMLLFSHKYHPYEECFVSYVMQSWSLGQRLRAQWWWTCQDLGGRIIIIKYYPSSKVRTWIGQGSGPCGDGEGGRGVIGRGGDENAIQITIYSYKYLIIYDIIIGENLLLTIIIGENFYYKGPSRKSNLTENFWGGVAPP